jgi:fatty acid synthase, animal type
VIRISITNFRIFQSGIDLDIAKLYPQIDFPVSRGTPMISPMIKWDHSQDLFVTRFSSSKHYGQRHVLVNISNKKDEYLQGHVIDGNFKDLR